MKARSFAQARRETASGFTLVELMIAVVVVALLASIALPSFMDSIRKSRRSEAFAALAQVQQAQERWRSNGSSYAESLTNAANGTPPGLGMASATTAKGYYTLSLSGAGASGYTVTATAVAGTSQASDGNCKVLAAQVQGGNLSYGSGADAAAYPDANRCWAK
ncbi:MAG: prepilin-type N-terminal cleavage/methylation domain-containing protein [Betaproteobacteria bacterium]|jgi:type IV pilus assembly protein PilE|nr:prepilin-type N-terminal cleavage/methylation domain-containing protein [Betaproteobacteria bacterium]